ncbi:MAG: sulfite exporter TauE/SafE family protein [Hyphomicrobiaceae bacterium]
MIWLLILALGLIGGVIGGVVGFGASILMMPVLVFAFGPKEAVPIMAIASVLANWMRVAIWWREVDWRANAAYCATAIPAAALGARTLIALDARMVEAGLGAFLIAVVPVRRWLMARGFSVTIWGLALVGAGIGFLTGLVASTGPLNTPFFLAYGLTKGAYISTEAVGSGAVSLVKSIVFRSFGVLPWETIARGLLVGASLMIGSWFAKAIVLRMDARGYASILEAMMVMAGLTMIYAALS